MTDAGQDQRQGQRQGPRRDQDGAVVVEFAIVFVLFITLLWGLITYGVIFAAQQSLAHAAAEATRSVVGLGDYDGDGDVDTDDATMRIEEVLRDQLSWLDDTSVSDDVTWVITYPACGSGTPQPVCALVTVSFNWRDHALVPSILDIATPSSLSSSASVQIG
jgi:Flp pilus assembly protein TadG